MMKKILVLAIVFLNITSMSMPQVNTNQINECVPQLNEIAVPSPNEESMAPLSLEDELYVIIKEEKAIETIEYVPSYDLTIIQNYITHYENRKEAAHDMAEAARSLGYLDEHPIIQIAKSKWYEADALLNLYKRDYDFWTFSNQKYPAATTIWIYLKNLGYNDYVCAGIMGNLMAEVGGGTLDIQYWLYGGKVHYGMCQWNMDYYPEVVGKDLAYQCDFLRDNIEFEMDTFGKKYAKDFKYKDFLVLTNAEEAAVAFAKCYERCYAGHYEVRKKNALKAYNYFVNKET